MGEVMGDEAGAGGAAGAAFDLMGTVLAVSALIKAGREAFRCSGGISDGSGCFDDGTCAGASGGEWAGG